MVEAVSTVNFDSGDAAKRAFKISVSPDSPKPGDAITISILSGDQWTLFSPYAELSGKSIQPAQSHVEVVDLGGNTAISTVNPVNSLIYAVTDSPIVDTDLEEVINGAGADVLSKFSSTNSALFYEDEDHYGSVRVSFQGFDDQRWTHDPFPIAGQYVLFAKNTETEDIELVIINISGADEQEGSVPSLTTIQAKDFCTDLPIENASVYVDNVLKGITDINGKLVVGTLNPGSYSIKIQSSGYTPTDGDDLANESFII